MGAAALAGTSVGVDRSRVALLLGFGAPITNALDAVSSRDFVVEAICCAELVMLDLSRLSEELVLWSSYEFGLVELADDYAASSSIMPQKKNPVAAEIVRAKCGSVLGRLVSVSSIIKALPYSYNLDLQETTAHLWSALDDTVGSVTVMSGMLATTKFNLRAISESMKSDYSTATSLANYLVKVEGISFRESHAVVGELVKISIEEGVPFEETVVERMPDVMSRLTKTGKRAKSIRRDTLGELLDPGRFLAAIVTPGGSNPSFIPAELASRTEARRRNRAAVSDLRASLASSENLLREAVVSAAGATEGRKREVKS